jgi:hypothetical protein
MLDEIRVHKHRLQVDLILVVHNLPTTVSSLTVLMKKSLFRRTYQNLHIILSRVGLWRDLQDGF